MAERVTHANLDMHLNVLLVRLPVVELFLARVAEEYCTIVSATHRRVRCGPWFGLATAMWCCGASAAGGGTNGTLGAMVGME
jgi:hypothetical protein